MRARGFHLLLAFLAGFGMAFLCFSATSPLNARAQPSRAATTEVNAPTAATAASFASATTTTATAEPPASSAGDEVQGKQQPPVWVNTKSGIYHLPGSRWYGHTQQGRYLAEAEARAAGYRAALNHQ